MPIFNISIFLFNSNINIQYFSSNFAGLLAFGVKESAWMNKIFTSINVMVLIFVVISGFVKGDLKNWSLNPEEILNTASNSSVK